MQQIKCARSLLTCWPPAVQSFSSATSIMYRNNKDWDFKGNPTSLVMNPLQGKPFVQGYNQRKRAYGMRTLACQSMGGEYALDRLKGIINMPILYDGSTNEKINMDKLATKNLFLLFSTLNIGRHPDQVINSLYPVYEKLQEDEGSVIVWIPVDEWTDGNQKTFEDLRTRMPWYTIKCILSEDMKPWGGKWSFIKREPIVWVMNMFGKDVGSPVALRDIQKKGVEAFPILAKKETYTP